MHVFGLVLYEMLSGRRAFDQPDFEALVSTIQNIQPPALISLRRDVPPALERLVDRCLIKEAKQRWQTAGEAVRELSTMVTPSSSSIWSHGWG